MVVTRRQPSPDSTVRGWDSNMHTPTVDIGGGCDSNPVKFGAILSLEVDCQYELEIEKPKILVTIDLQFPCNLAEVGNLFKVEIRN